MLDVIITDEREKAVVRVIVRASCDRKYETVVRTILYLEPSGAIIETMKDIKKFVRQHNAMKDAYAFIGHYLTNNNKCHAVDVNAGLRTQK